jgi:hypothetical protein
MATYLTKHMFYLFLSLARFSVWPYPGVGLGRLVAGIVGSNLSQGMDVYPRLSVLCCPV